MKTFSQILLPLLLILSTSARASTVTLDIAASTETNVAYRVWISTNQIDWSADATAASHYETTNLTFSATLPAGNYYAAVQVYDLTTGINADLSPQITFRVPKGTTIRVRMTLQSTAAPGEPWKNVVETTAHELNPAEMAFYRVVLDTETE